MKWKIVADSGCDIRQLEGLNKNVSYEFVPLMLDIGGDVFVDNQDINIERLLDAMEKERSAASSACPAPATYAEAYKGAENVIVFTISSNLSGSYNSASLGKDLLLEENPNVNIHVFDTLSAGAEMNILVRKAAELANKEVSFDELVKEMKDYHQHTNISFLLESVDNLVKNGRVNKILGQMIGLLGIKLIGQRSSEGRIELAHKSKGTKRALKTLLSEFDTKKFNGNIMEISHSLNPAGAEQLKKQVLDKFPNAVIRISEMSGLCNFYAERSGLIIGFETK